MADAGMSSHALRRPLRHLTVKKYLKPLANDDILKVGLELGLEYTRLKNLKSSSDFLDEVVHSWLREDDNVSTTSGTPSWDSLAKALKEAGCDGVASKIKEGMIFDVNRVFLMALL